MRRKQPKFNDVMNWLEDKGVELWPGVSASLTDEKERRIAAEWFLKQIDELAGYIDKK